VSGLDLPWGRVDCLQGAYQCLGDCIVSLSRFASLCVCPLITRERLTPNFQVALGHPRDYFRHKKLGVVGKGQKICTFWEV